jgi:hypothetical protein
MVAVISYLRFDPDSLGSMVVNSSVAHNLRCTGVATFRAKRIGLDLSGNATTQDLTFPRDRKTVTAVHVQFTASVVQPKRKLMAPTAAKSVQ